MSDPASLLLELLLFSPFTVPYQLLEPDLGPPCGWSFPAAPYAQHGDGYIAPATCDPSAPPEGQEMRPRKMHGSRSVAGQASLEGLVAIDGSYGRVEGRGRFLTESRFELDAAVADYFEPGATSPGWLGQMHVDVRFAQHENVQFRAGAGVRGRLTEAKPFVGFDALYAVDVFWPRPVATTVEVSGGTLGVNGWAAEVRGTAGYVVGLAELYAGWDGLWVGAPRQRTEFLGGPVLGARAYF
jgi:hypothetical protein